MFKEKFLFEVPECFDDYLNYVPPYDIVDQEPNQDFNYNVHQYIRNDIAKLLDLQNEQAFSVALNNLNEVPVSSNIPSDLPLEEQIKYVIPPKLQDPVDVQRVIDYKFSLEAARLKSEMESSQSTSLDDVSVNSNVNSSEGAS